MSWLGQRGLVFFFPGKQIASTYLPTSRKIFSFFFSTTGKKKTKQFRRKFSERKVHGFYLNYLAFHKQKKTLPEIKLNYLLSKFWIFTFNKNFLKTLTFLQKVMKLLKYLAGTTWKIFTKTKLYYVHVYNRGLTVFCC